jgi:hypothetical protein
MSTERVLAAAAALLLSTTLAPAQRAEVGSLETLRAAFDRPPDAARPMMRWWWYGVASSPAQIRRDLGAMKAAGIGGAEIQSVYPLTLDSPREGTVNHPFLSDAFLGLVREAHVQARALGLRMDLTLGSGWPYGGPWVSIDDAAGQLRVERIAVPPGVNRLARPAMTAGDAWVGAFIGPEGVAEPGAEAMRPLEWPAGAAFLALEPKPGVRQAWVFISSHTGMMVKRPAVGSEGYVLSHYDRGALDRYLGHVGARLLGPPGSTPPFAVFCDSLEVYNSDWTADLPAEFARRRGYDVLPHLPAFAADRGTAGAMVREDWGRTLTELLNERFIGPLAAWAHARGTKLRMQGYGIPPATVSSNAAIDLPEGEGHHWRQLTASRWASSASHLFDRPVASSETWTWLHSPSFRATPLDLKAEADRHFLQGITQLIGHGWPSTPEGQDYPGWRFYAAGAFNEKNPWWIVMPDLSRYLQRVSAVMRVGRPGNDVALYLPVADAYAHAVNGRWHLLELVKERLGEEIVGSILDAGYGFDAVDDEALVTHARLEGDAVAIGAGRYRIIVLPAMDAMPAATLEVLERIAASGVVVVSVARSPARPSGRHSDAERSAFAARATALFGGRAQTVPDAGASLRRALNERVHPPIRIAAGSAREADATRVVPSDVGTVERRVEGGSVFFVANTSNEARDLRVSFASPRRIVEEWDAVTGTMLAADHDSTGAVRLALAPYESRLLLARDRPAREAEPLTTVRAPVGRGRTAGTLIDRWRIAVGGFAVEEGVAAGPREPTTRRGWDAERTTRYFSGVGTYETSFVVDLNVNSGTTRVWLDFGEGTPVLNARPGERASNNGFRALLDSPIREAAVIEVNGRRAGSLWAPPYRIEITSAVRAGENQLRVRVGNTAMNYMAGQALPDYRLLNLRYGERFVPQDMAAVQPLPSGLTAPVRVIVQ